MRTACHHGVEGVLQPVAMVTVCYHGAGVLLQFSGGDGVSVVEEQILKEALRGQTKRHDNTSTAGRALNRTEPAC